MSRTQVEQLLTPTFNKKHVNAMLRHFEGMTKNFQQEEWEDCIAKGGKFIEASLKALFLSAGQALQTGRGFKVDSVINGLAGLPSSSTADTIRLTIPRVCRFVYEIASNRGGRHDPDEIDPNEMDANAVVMNCSWIVAEMIRHAQHGKVDSDIAKTIVDSLVKRHYPLIEKVDGRTYFHLDNASAVDIALVCLAHSYPKRMSIIELTDMLKRHSFSASNARVTIQRIRKHTDQTAKGDFRLLAPGLKRAEQVMRTHHLKEDQQ